MTPEKVYRREDILRLKGVERSTLRRWISAGKFPQPDSAPTPHSATWLESTLVRIGLIAPSSADRAIESQSL